MPTATRSAGCGFPIWRRRLAPTQQNPPLSFGCSLAAAYVAFPRTQADADRTHDAHRPVLERYPSRNDYVSRIRVAARELGQEGFLLPEDQAIIIQSAAESPLWRASPTP